MDIKTYLLFSIICCFVSCNENEEVIEATASKNLQEYITTNNTKELDEVIACAASKDGENDISYVFYYPIIGATNIQYFETENIDVTKDDFELYKPINLASEDVFNGYLERFIRNDATESWCVVTYETTGKIHISNPIRLKNDSKPTAWIEDATIDTSTSLMPHFFWEDGVVKENEIYFQVLSSAEDDFISGTYTFDKNFQFYDLDNVVLNITPTDNPTLAINQEHNFTMMGVSIDNWVNLVIQKTFTTQ